jgi:hypothetical protein
MKYGKYLFDTARILIIRSRCQHQDVSILFEQLLQHSIDLLVVCGVLSELLDLPGQLGQLVLVVVDHRHHLVVVGAVRLPALPLPERVHQMLLLALVDVQLQVQPLLQLRDLQVPRQYCLAHLVEFVLELLLHPLDPGGVIFDLPSQLPVLQAIDLADRLGLAQPGAHLLELALEPVVVGHELLD